MRKFSDNLVSLGCHGVFYTGFICQGHQKLFYKVVVGICIPRIRMVRMTVVELQGG